VRFNAEKQQVGSYFSTKIWNFGMKAPCCGERIEVQTDPKNHEYVIIRGARRKARRTCCPTLACGASDPLSPALLPLQWRRAFTSAVGAVCGHFAIGESVRRGRRTAGRGAAPHRQECRGLGASAAQGAQPRTYTTSDSWVSRTRGSLARCFGPAPAHHPSQRRQEEGYTAEDAGTHELPDREAAGRPGDALARLEAATEDRRRGLEGAERLAELAKDAQARFGDDYAMNKALRRRLRCTRARGSVWQRAAGAGLQPSRSFAAPPSERRAAVALVSRALGASDGRQVETCGALAARAWSRILSGPLRAPYHALDWRVAGRRRASFASFLTAFQSATAIMPASATDARRRS